jgi:hypothetical protein
MSTALAFPSIEKVHTFEKCFHIEEAKELLVTPLTPYW